MPVAASAEDLREAASGKASPRDLAEAGVKSAKEAQAKLKSQQHRKGGYRGHGKIRKGKHPRAVASRKQKN